VFADLVPAVAEVNHTVLNPTEKVWSALKLSMANFPDRTATALARAVKNRLKRMQYRHQLVDVVEVEAAGAVEGFFGAAGVWAAGEDGVFVAVAAGQVDREAPTAGLWTASPARRRFIDGHGRPAWRSPDPALAPGYMLAMSRSTRSS
jgi:hypothetical protein